jgi:hypothetical protein
MKRGMKDTQDERCLKSTQSNQNEKQIEKDGQEQSK